MKKKKFFIGGLIIAGAAVTMLCIGKVSADVKNTGFIIDTIDNNEDSVEGALYDIYGKPEVTWDIPEEKISLSLSKEWNYDDNRDGLLQSQ